MVHHHVAERTDRVVEMPAILHAEILGHRDLHRVDVVAVPHRLQQRVAETQVEDLLEPHLPKVVVDPQQLRLVEVLVDVGGERVCRLRVVAERLLHDDMLRSS